MSRWSWRSLIRALTSRRRAAPGPRPRPPAARCRPQVEALEDRAVPAVLTVNSVDDNTTSDAVLTLREALSLVNAAGDLGRQLSVGEAAQIAGPFGDADTVQFAPGLSGPLRLQSGAMGIGKSVTLTGPAGGLTIDAHGNSRIFQVDDGAAATTIAVAISGLTLTDGRAATGGAIANAEDLSLTNCTLSGNSAEEGGGIYNAGTATLTDCTFSGNSATEGGGIINDGTATLTDCTLSDNSASSRGGGIYNLAGRATLTVTNCTLSGNSAFLGGGIYNHGTATLTDCTLSDNSATEGGGISNLGTATLTDCTFSGNSATFGGGIINDGTATLTDCTLSDNSASSRGGGIHNLAGRATLTVTNCTLSGNSAFQGGGIYNAGTATLTNCTLSGNSATEGGGIFNTFGTATLTDCTLSGNSATFGGGIINDGTATLTDCTLSDNSASSRGGGIFNLAGTATLTVTNCTLSGNSAFLGGGLGGGGIFNHGTATLTNCTLSDNSAFLGGGISNLGTATLTNCTLSDNSATFGGGIYNDGTATLNNSIVANSPSGGDVLSTSLGTLTGSNNLIESVFGAVGLTGTLTADPNLGPLASNGGPTLTHALLPTSPALNAGTADGAPSTDQRGAGRVGPVDIGAFERQRPLLAGAAGRPLVAVYDAATGTELHRFRAFAGYRGGVRVAVGDVNGDGFPDIIAGTARGPARVKVFSGGDPSTVLYDFNAFGGRSGGVSVAAGDLNRDGFADLIVGRGAGKATVQVFSGQDGTLLRRFRAYGGGYAGGVNVAAADLDRDGIADIITAGNGGGRVPVQVFSGADPGQVLHRFFAYHASFQGPVFVAAGDTDGDGQVDLISGAGPDGGPHVRVFDGGDPTQVLHSFMAYTPKTRHGVTVAAADRDGDGAAEILVGQASGAPQVKTFDGLSAAEVDDFFAYEPGSGEGVFVGG